MLKLAEKPLYKDYKVVVNQTAKDIAGAIIKSIKDSKNTADFLAPYVKSKDPYQTCKNVFTFCKNNITYIKEGKDLQTAKTLTRILADKFGDCKHMSITAYSLLKACGVNCRLRLISQNFYNSDPTHIYVVALINNEIVIIDPVLKNFDNEARYYYKYDLKA